MARQGGGRRQLSLLEREQARLGLPRYYAQPTEPGPAVRPSEHVGCSWMLKGWTCPHEHPREDIPEPAT